jgi:hypothetical protein
MDKHFELREFYTLSMAGATSALNFLVRATVILKFPQPKNQNCLTVRLCAIF